MSKVLIISNDTVDSNMAGCGLRPYEIAKFLGRFHDVILSVPSHSKINDCNFKLIISNHDNLKKIIREIDVVITQGAILYTFPFIKDASIPIVVEIYTPFILEGLEVSLEKETKIYRHNKALWILIEQILSGDYFICANESQRDFILGMLCILNRLNPVNYKEDKTFRRLIEVVPFGIPSDESKHTKNVLKGIYKNIKTSDKVILWLGGIWNWLDPITPIKAIETICQKRDDVKLLFLGIKHPVHPIMKMCEEALELSKKLGLYNKYVFFEEWIPYNDRSNYLMEADIGIVTHPNHIETRFSHRTRIADYLWSNLPIIATRGGVLSDFIEQKKLGITVDYEDTDSLADAIFKLLNNNKFYTQCKENIRNIYRQFRWDEILKPLNEFCKDPKIAPDKEYLKQWRFRFKSEALKKKRLKYYSNRLKDIYNKEGATNTIKYCLSKIYEYGCKTICL